MHIIPRYENGPSIVSWTPGTASPEELAQIAEKLRAACKDEVTMEKKMDADKKKKFEEMYLDFQLILRKMAYVNDIPYDYIDDVVQDTFVSYAHYDYSLDLPLDNTKMLLITILKSRCMDFHRKMKHRSYGELDEEAYNSESYPSHDNGQSSLICGK